ncbi:MAG: putative sulfate exporter family transporter [Polyangiaceae bacterium]
MTAANGRLLLIAAAGISLFFVPGSPALGLIAGVAIACTLGNPIPAQTRTWSRRALAVSVVGLGAGMDLVVVGRVGLNGLSITIGSIGLALSLGWALGRSFGVPRDTALLISIGTAICGGSAIAAVAPTIRAREGDISVALSVVFLLNSIALFLFPAVGHLLALSQDSFGLWSALAIHDTSSVVGAASQYGPRALEVATATKLARALWIVPVTFGIAVYRARAKGTDSRVAALPRIPWFIGAFIIAAALVTYVPSLGSVGHLVSALSHRVLRVTLFLIGLGLTRRSIRALGVRPLLQAALLWILLTVGTLVAVRLTSS